MQQQWNEDQPIYRQLQERMIDLILSGALPEGEAIPSVRNISSEYQINHLTVSKAYQALVDGGLVEKRRGLGMFVVKGAREMVLVSYKKQFVDVELPNFLHKMEQLGISIDELIGLIKQHQKGKSS